MAMLSQYDAQFVPLKMLFVQVRIVWYHAIGPLNVGIIVDPL